MKATYHYIMHGVYSVLRNDRKAVQHALAFYDEVMKR